MIWTSDDAGKGLKPNHALAIGKAGLLGIVEWNDKLSVLLDTGKQLELAAIN